MAFSSSIRARSILRRLMSLRNRNPLSPDLPPFADAEEIRRIQVTCVMTAQASIARNPVASSKFLEYPVEKIGRDEHDVYKLCVQERKNLIGTFLPALSVQISRRLSSYAGKMSINTANEEGIELQATLDNYKMGSNADKVNDINLHNSKGSNKRDVESPLYMTISKAPRDSVSSALNEWINQGNTLERGEISNAMINLRRRHLYDKALQLLEWLEESKRFDFVERDYASHLDLVAKTHGLQEAETYIDKVPESFKGEVVYRTLLANCVAVSNVKKAEKVFGKMRDLSLPISAFAYNQLLLLYRRISRKKIPDVLLMMEKENVKPSVFTYMILIDAKGLARDITGMESILESMKTEGVVPDNAVRAMVAGHYISAGLNEKAEATLKEIEDGFKENTDAWKFLLPLYAALHKVDDVKRVWKSCEATASVDVFKAAIDAYGKIGLVEDAEIVFEKMTQKWEKVPPRCYNALLKVYADHKLLSKGKDLARKMSEAGCWIGPLTWDALVKLFAKAGEVEKADSVLEIAVQQRRPLYSSYIALLEKYAEMGDVYNAEKIFHWLREAEYPRRVRQYQLLAEAYKNAKAPAYGLRERMKAENVYPDKQFSAVLDALTDL